MKTIVLTTAAAKDLLALPLGVQTAIEAALDDYAMTGNADVKRLKGSEYLRMRVGRYRVIFSEDGVTILAIAIAKRDTTTYKGDL